MIRISCNCMGSGKIASITVQKERKPMYTKEPAEYQYSFKHDWFMVPDVDYDHEIIRIAD